MLKVIVFDLDGTILDSAPLIQDILNNMRQEYGYPILSKETYMPWMSLGGMKLVEKTFELYNEKDIKNTLDNFRKKYKLYNGTASPLYRGVSTALQTLKRYYKVCLCTNKPKILVDKILSDHSILNSFDMIVTGNDDKTDKPNPQKFLSCVKKFNCHVDESMFVGDAILDYTTAKNANTKFGLHSNGYNDGVDVNKCDMVFNNYDDLYNKLNEIS